MVTWLESEERVVEVAVAEFRRSPISPVAWANAEDNSVFSLINWSECARLQGGYPGEHSHSGRLFGPPWVHEDEKRKKN